MDLSELCAGMCVLCVNKKRDAQVRTGCLVILVKKEDIPWFP